MTGLETEQKSNENNNNDYGTSDKNGQPGIAKTSRIVNWIVTRLEDDPNETKRASTSKPKILMTFSTVSPDKSPKREENADCQLVEFNNLIFENSIIRELNINGNVQTSARLEVIENGVHETDDQLPSSTTS